MGSRLNYLKSSREGHAPDAVYEEARKQFDEKELADLTLAARNVPGAFQPHPAKKVPNSSK